MKKQEKEKEIVIYDNQYWVLESTSEAGTVTLWRNGKKVVVLEEEIKYQMPF